MDTIWIATFKCWTVCGYKVKEINCRSLLQVEEIILDDTQQCQQNTHFIRILLDDIINNALGNLDKSSDDTKITARHTNEMSTIIQQFTSDDTLIPVPNDIPPPWKIILPLYLPPALVRVLKN